MIKKIAALLIVSFLVVTSGMAGSYQCTFTQKKSYSNWEDTTPNKIRSVNMKVVYRVSGNDLLTLPAGTSTTYAARFTRKSLDRNGNLYLWFRSNIGYSYGLSEDMSHVLEATPSGKTILLGSCRPIY